LVKIRQGEEEALNRIQRKVCKKSNFIYPGRPAKEGPRKKDENCGSKN
jgi:hypothetical protein